MKWSSVVIGVAAGLILGLVAGFELGAHVTTQIRNQLMSAHSQPMLEVVVAARDLPAGTVLTHRDLAKTKVPDDRVPERHCVRVDKAKDIVGKKLVFSVEKGRPILWPDIEPEDKPQEWKTNLER